MECACTSLQFVHRKKWDDRVERLVVVVSLPPLWINKVILLLCLIFQLSSQISCPGTKLKVTEKKKMSGLNFLHPLYLTEKYFFPLVESRHSNCFAVCDFWFPLQYNYQPVKYFVMLSALKRNECFPLLWKMIKTSFQNCFLLIKWKQELQPFLLFPFNFPKMIQIVSLLFVWLVGWLFF